MRQAFNCVQLICECIIFQQILFYRRIANVHLSSAQVPAVTGEHLLAGRQGLLGAHGPEASKGQRAEQPTPLTPGPGCSQAGAARDLEELSRLHPQSPPARQPRSPHLVSLVQGLLPVVQLLIQVAFLFTKQLLKQNRTFSLRLCSLPPCCRPHGAPPTNLLTLQVDHLLLQGQLCLFDLLEPLDSNRESRRV